MHSSQEINFSLAPKARKHEEEALGAEARLLRHPTPLDFGFTQ